MNTLLHDLRYAARTLRRTPAFSVAVVLTLMLGIGAATLVFSVVNGVLLRPLPLPDDDRLLLVWSRSGQSQQSWLSYPEFTDLRDSGGVFAGVAALRDRSFNVTGLAVPEQVAALAVSANLLDVLGVRPVLGRAFDATEDRPGGAPVVLLSHGYWGDRYGGDAAVVGRAIQLDGEPHMVVGVLPAGFRLLPPSSVFPADAAVWVPLEPTLEGGVLRNRDVRHLHVVGRLADGATAAQAQAEVERLAARMRRDHPEAYPAADWGMYAVSFREQIVRGVRPALWALFGAVGLLVLLVCANVANLLLARNAGRAVELATRASLGAGRARLVRQLFAESLLLALLGGAGGLMLAALGIEIVASLGAAVPRMDEITLDGRVLGFSLLAAATTALLVGLAPAWQAAGRDVAGALRGGGAGAEPRSTRLRRLLVVSQLSLAVALLTGTALLARSLHRLQQAPVGFDPAGVLTLRITLPDASYPDMAAREAFAASAVERIAALPGVSAAGVVTQLPFSGAHLGSAFWPEGDGAEEPRLAADLRGVTPDYFRAMGIPLLSGRGFALADRRDAPWVAVIDATLAARLWPGTDPIGQRLVWQRAPDRPLEVVGVAAAVRHTGAGDAPRETVYRPYAQYTPPTPLYLAIRGVGDPAALALPVRAEIHGLDAALPIAEVRRMSDRLDESLGQPRFQAVLAGLLGGIALLVAAVGIYGVVAFGVALRTRELGIRTALGASRSDVLRLLVGEGMAMAAAGVAVGVAAALAFARLLAGLLYGVSPTDTVSFLAGSLVLAAVALLASYLPARRASRVDPMIALRSE